MDAQTTIEHLTVLGTGVLGAQIAVRASDAGFAVPSYGIDDDVLVRAGETFDGLATTYAQQGKGAAFHTRRRSRPRRVWGAVAPPATPFPRRRSPGRTGIRRSR